MLNASSLTPIVFATDSRYVRPLCVALRSLIATCEITLHVIVLHQDLDAESLATLERHAARAGVTFEARASALDVRGLPLWGWVSGATYLRLAIAAALPEFSRALYLDCDVLAVGSLAELVTTDLKGELIGAVQDPMNPLVRSGLALPGWRDLGMQGECPYFNAGVLLLDLAACREAQLFERAAWFLQNRRQHVKLWDQDALNWATEGRWLPLARCWNTLPLSAMLKMFGTPPFVADMLPFEVLLADEDCARILHFAGPRKPWQGRYPAGMPASRYEQMLAEVDRIAPALDEPRHEVI